MTTQQQTTGIKFGTDGWRGVMARDFTFENVRKVAQALAHYLKDPSSGYRPLLGPKTVRGKNPAPAVVGYDRRFQSEQYAQELAEVLQSGGISVTLLSEPLPTPALSWLTHRLGAVGVMVTASHNPPAYNGIKIKIGGRAAPLEITEAVESHLAAGGHAAAKNGQAEVKSFRQAYLSYVKSKFKPGLFSRLKRTVVVDYLHGNAAGLMEELLPSSRLAVLHSKRDPLFGGMHPEPVEANLGELKEAVRRHKALVGIAFDGDADRIGIVDDQGNYFDPCRVFPLLLRYLLEKRKLKGKIVQSVSLGYLSERIAQAHGLPFEEVPVGFKFIAEKMLSEPVAVGGEESGGYAWKGVLPERDGPLSGLLFLEMLLETKKTPSQLYREIEKKYGKSFFQRVDIHLLKPVADKKVFAERIQKKLPKKILGSPVKEARLLDGIKIILERGEWLLIRPSGTEPLMRTYAETDSPKKTAALLELARSWAGRLVA